MPPVHRTVLACDSRGCTDEDRVQGTATCAGWLRSSGRAAGQRRASRRRSGRHGRRRRWRLVS
eukprot:8707141-Heterocapsa_arctica.AAC.1